MDDDDDDDDDDSGGDNQFIVAALCFSSHMTVYSRMVFDLSHRRGPFLAMRQVNEGDICKLLFPPHIHHSK